MCSGQLRDTEKKITGTFPLKKSRKKILFQCLVLSRFQDLIILLLDVALMTLVKVIGELYGIVSIFSLEQIILCFIMNDVSIAAP